MSPHHDRGNGEVSLAVIGLGVGAKHAAAAQVHQRANVVSLCDHDRERLDAVGLDLPQARRTTDPDTVLCDPEVDAVIIASHDGYHAEQVLEALANGKHVFVEKPLCTSRDELRAIDDALVANPGLVLSSNLILRQEPRLAGLKRRIDAGELGLPYLLEGSYDFGRFEQLTDGWRGRIPNYSVMHGGGIHLIDLLLWFKGGGVREVMAMSSSAASRGTTYPGNDLEVALIRFWDGSVGSVTANFASVAPHHHRITVFGTEGTFVQDHLGAGYIFSRDPAAPIERDEIAYPIAEKGALIGRFVDSCLGITPPAISASEVLRAMAVSIAIGESAVSGSSVRPQEIHR